jgi:hypothetical protein
MRPLPDVSLYERKRELCLQMLRGEPIALEIEGSVVDIVLLEDAWTWRASLDGIGFATGDAYDVATAALEASESLTRSSSRKMHAVRRLPALADTPTRPTTIGKSRDDE